MKRLLITGASRGIGRALVEAYLKKGWIVFAISRNLSYLENLKLTYNSNLFLYSCDVSDLSQVQTATNSALELLKNIDLAILNAGISGSESFINFNVEKFKHIYDTNLFGVLNFFETLIPAMINQGGGTIAAVSSLADVRGFPGSAAYSSSKAALTRTLEAARAELFKYNIKVITIRPGFVRTDMTAKNRFPMPFMIEPEKAAEIIINGIENGKLHINFPFPTYLLTSLIQLLPDTLFDRIMKNYKVQIDD